MILNNKRVLKIAFAKLQNAFFAVFFVSALCSFLSISANAQKVKISTKGKTPVILIHGIGGADLRQEARGLWQDGGFPNDVLKFKAGDPYKLQFDSTGNPRTDTISRNVVAVGFYDVPMVKNITDLSKSFRKSGYRLNENLFEFFYDFRFSVLYNAEKLAEKIERWKQFSGENQFDIVAHSMGGLIAKAYLTNEERAANIRTLIFVGTPHLGAPKALKALRYGDDLDIAIIDGCKLKRVLHNLPGAMNLLPGRKYFELKGGYFYDEDDIDADGTRGLLDWEKMIFNLENGKETICPLNPKVDVTPADKDSPLDRLNAALLKKHAFDFHDALDDWKKPQNVKVYNLVGYGVSTIEKITQKDGKVTLGYTTEGDGTVPVWSAETVESDAVYFVDLSKLKLEHSASIGDKNYFEQIYNLLNKGAGVYVKNTSTAKPVTAFTRNSRGLVFQ